MVKGNSMKRNKRTNFHIVDKPNAYDEMQADIIEELDEEKEIIEDLEKKIKKHKFQSMRRVVVRTGLVLLLILGAYLVVTRQSYTKIRVVGNYLQKEEGNSRYVEFGDGVIQYSRDGVSYRNKKGRELWNQPCQIQNPIFDINKESLAVADSGGNDILVFNKTGLKGEIHTTMPIEKISVSAQGIVSAILKNETTPQVVVYDAAGNLLVEHKASVSGTGYPTDIAISENGYSLLVSYMYVKDGRVMTRIAHYNFGDAGQEKSDFLVGSEEFKDTIMPYSFYMGNKISGVVGDDKFLLYKGENVPELVKTIEIDKEIKSVFHNKSYVGFVLKNKGKAGYELRLYDAGGAKLMSENFTGEYSHVEIHGSQIVMFSGKKCSIYTKSGLHRFEGEFEEDIIEIFPIMGVNKYLVMSQNGMKEIRLVK